MPDVRAKTCYARCAWGTSALHSRSLTGISTWCTASQVPSVLVYYNSDAGRQEDVSMTEGRDAFWQDAIPQQAVQVRSAIT